MPKITVGMPVYNGERYVEESIKSVLAQTFDDFEFLISDNGSSDRTAEICQDYASRDSRISLIRNKQNIGASANYNTLVQKATAPYFRWSNADDLLAPTLHAACLTVLETNSDAVLAAGKTVLIDENGAETGLWDDNLHLTQSRPSERLTAFFEQANLTNVIYGLMRTQALRQTDLMGNGSVPAADTILMGQLVLHGHFIQIDEPLFYRRMHDESSSANRDDTQTQENFWSAGTGKFSRPGWRRLAAYMRGISNASLDLGEAMSLYKLIVRQAWMSKRRLSVELIRPNIS